MKTKLFLTGLLAMIFSISFAQLDIPPGGIPGFPPGLNCPPGVWCHPEGAGMSITDSDIDAINKALDNPEGCCCACALGKLFVDIVKPLYPDCYPNCNITTNSESEKNETQINKAKAVAAKGKITAETYNYFRTQLPDIFAKNKYQATALEGIKGSKFKLSGMWVHDEDKKGEIRILGLEPIDLKSGASVDKLYLLFNKNSILLLNQSWINAKKKKK